MKLTELFTTLTELLDKKQQQKGKTAWVIPYTGSKLILGKRSEAVNNPNLWNFFGGHLDSGESPIAAAARELEEETGHKVSQSQLKLITTINGASYFTLKVGNESDLGKSSEISKVKAYKLTDLPNNLHSKTAAFFDRLEDLLT